MIRKFRFYILNEENVVVPVNDVVAVSRWVQSLPPEDATGLGRRIASTSRNGVNVSTIFFCCDQALLGDGPPVVFESMVFADDPEVDKTVQRYTSFDEALEGHNEFVRIYIGAPTDDKDV